MLPQQYLVELEQKAQTRSVENTIPSIDYKIEPKSLQFRDFLGRFTTRYDLHTIHVAPK